MIAIIAGGGNADKKSSGQLAHGQLVIYIAMINRCADKNEQKETDPQADHRKANGQFQALRKNSSELKSGCRNDQFRYRRNKPAEICVGQIDAFVAEYVDKNRKAHDIDADAPDEP